jgi:nucleoside-specific outer membrane channel protein Tsx
LLIGCLRGFIHPEAASCLLAVSILAAQQSAEKVNAVELKSKIELANTIYNQNKVVAEEDSLV